MAAINVLPEPPNATSPDSPAPITYQKLDFPALGLPEYEGSIAIVIDNLFTPDDCATLLKAAESSSKWQKAAVNGPPGSGSGVVDTSYRNSGRIMYDDHELTTWILEKLRPYLTEIETQVGEFHQLYTLPRHRNEEGEDAPLVKLTRINERLRFLKYGKGQFFKRHVDSIYYTPDMKEISYYTLQIYLKGDARTLKGGATRIWSRSTKEAGNHKGHNGVGKWVDVEARVGRVLIFQQSRSRGNIGILHGGEEVTKGKKISVRTDLMYASVVEE